MTSGHGCLGPKAISVATHSTLRHDITTIWNIVADMAHQTFNFFATRTKRTYERFCNATHNLKYVTSIYVSWCTKEIMPNWQKIVIPATMFHIVVRACPSVQCTATETALRPRRPRPRVMILTYARDRRCCCWDNRSKTKSSLHRPAAAPAGDFTSEVDK